MISHVCVCARAHARVYGGLDLNNGCLTLPANACTAAQTKEAAAAAEVEGRLILSELGPALQVLHTHRAPADTSERARGPLRTRPGCVTLALTHPEGVHAAIVSSHWSLQALPLQVHAPGSHHLLRLFGIRWAWPYPQAGQWAKGFGEARSRSIKTQSRLNKLYILR